MNRRRCSFMSELSQVEIADNGVPLIPEAAHYRK